MTDMATTKRKHVRCRIYACRVREFLPNTRVPDIWYTPYRFATYERTLVF